jgi:DNA (cytosine-5)-methyltransferase 1
MDQLPVVSLFSGVGCLDVAVERCAEPPLLQDGTPGPYRVAVATDYEPKALDVLRANFPDVATLAGDITEISSRELMDAAGIRPGEAGLVVGGPPCTPFSKSGFWIADKVKSRDPDASLLDDYVRIVREVQPEAFVLENVQALTYRNHAGVFARLLQGLDSAGYSVGWRVLIAADYGVPQLRRRVFLIGRRDRGPLRLPRATHSGWSERDRKVDVTKLPYVTCKEVLGDLLPGDPEPSEVVEGRYADLAAEVPPGANYLWHTERGGGRDTWKWRSRYWTFLLRLDPDRPATTIQAQPGPWVGPFHWENVETSAGPRARRLRVAEIRRLQTLPDEFQLRGDRRDIQRQLGNAVPVELGKAVVRSLAESLGRLERPDQEPLADQLAML